MSGIREYGPAAVSELVNPILVGNLQGGGYSVGTDSSPIGDLLSRGVLTVTTGPGTLTSSGINASTSSPHTLLPGQFVRLVSGETRRVQTTLTTTTFTLETAFSADQAGAAWQKVAEGILAASAGPGTITTVGYSLTCSQAHGLAANDFVTLTSGAETGEVRRAAVIVSATQAIIERAFSGDQAGASWTKTIRTNRSVAVESLYGNARIGPVRDSQYFDLGGIFDAVHSDSGIFFDQDASAAPVSALMTELSGHILTMAINTPQISQRIADYPGGIFRLDSRMSTATGAGTLSTTGTAVTFSGAHGLNPTTNNEFIKLTSGPQSGEIRKVTAIPLANTATLATAFSVNQVAQSWQRIYLAKLSALGACFIINCWPTGSTYSLSDENPALLIDLNTGNIKAFNDVTVAGTVKITSSILEIGNNDAVRAVSGEIRSINGAVLAWRNAANDADGSFGMGSLEQFETVGVKSITDNLTDGYAAAIRFDPYYNCSVAGKTVTRGTYMDFTRPVLGGANPPSLTDMTVFRFGAAAGTHEAIDTSTMLGDGWVKINVNGAVNYVPYSVSKTTWSNNLTISNTAPSIVLTDTTASAKSLTVAVDANAVNIRESAGAAGSLLVLDLANNRVGIGGAPENRAFEVNGTVNGTPAQFRTHNNQTNNVRNAMILEARTTGDMADAYGVGILFQIRDTAAADNSIARVDAVRAGSDNTGDLVFSTSVSGSLTEKMRLTSAGAIRSVGANGQSLDIKQATTTVASNNGNPTITATNLIPAGSLVLGVSVTVTTTYGNGGGLTTIKIGDGSTTDKWAAALARTAGAGTTIASFTTSSPTYYTATASVILTANAGNFDADGAARITVFYIDITAATS